MKSRRQFIIESGYAAVYGFLAAAACAPEKLFGPRKPRPLSMGVSVFTGWADPRPEYGLVPGVQCPVQHPWAAMQTPNRVPAIGQYNEADPAVTSWRLEQMQRGGVDWCTYQHEWSPNLGQLLMNHCAENHPDDSPVSFAFSWWDVLASSPDGVLYYSGSYFDSVPAWTADQVRESLRSYGRAVYPFTRKASYLHVDDRPVLFRGGAQSLAFYGQWGISPKDVLDLISEAFPVRPYWIATGTDHAVHEQLKSWGFGAFTEYALYSASWAGAMDLYRDFWARSIEISRTQGIDFWVPALAGFDARGYLFEQDAAKLGFFEPPDPAAFTAHLIEARSFAEAHYDRTRGRVISYAWSEWYEGGVIEPCAPGMLHNGDEMLRAHAAAAGKAA